MSSPTEPRPTPVRNDRTHFLYIAVIVSVFLGIIPKSLLSSLTEGQVLQTVLVALLVGFALQAMGSKGQPILVGIGHIQRLVFKILSMIMWVAPVGAFGAIATVVGAAGSTA